MAPTLPECLARAFVTNGCLKIKIPTALLPRVLFNSLTLTPFTQNGTSVTLALAIRFARASRGETLH